MIAMAVALAATVIGLAATIERIAGPSMGAMMPSGKSAIREGGMEIVRLPAADTPLRDGDLVVAIAERSMEDWTSDLLAGGPRLTTTLGDQIDVRVIRASEAVDLHVGLAPFPTLAVLLANAGTLAFVFVLAGLGAFVFWRRPGDRAAAALFILGAGALGSTIPFLLGSQPLDFATGRFAFGSLAITAVYMLVWTGAIHFGLVYPRPLPLVVRRPVLIPAVYAGAYGSYALAILASWRLASSALDRMATALAFQLVIVVAALVIVAWAVLAQWRIAGAEERRGLRGLALAGAFTIAATALMWVVPEAVDGQPIVPWNVAGLIGIPVPIALGMAILRHGAFDLQVAVNRSIVYGSLTLVIVGVYVAVLTILGAVLTEQAGFLTALLATGIVAVVVQPVRDLLQRSANRLMYGYRDEPYIALTRLGERLESALEPDEILPAIAGAVASALRAPFVAIELLRDGVFQPAAAIGSPTGEPMALALAHGGETVGRLLVAARGSGEGFGFADRRLLEDMARQSAVAARTLLLTEDLRLSRKRLVTAREEERRRLRRDLHGGLEPTLARLQRGIAAASAAVPESGSAAHAIVVEARGAAQAAIGSIRRIVYDLRPPALDELGLPGAVRRQVAPLGAAAGVPVSVAAPETFPTLPAAVEVAAYRITVAAVEGVLAAATGAREGRVTLTMMDALEVSVEFETAAVGEHTVRGLDRVLKALEDEAADLGGAARLTSDGNSVRLWARLPLVAP